MVLDGEVEFDHLKRRVESLGKTIEDPEVTQPIAAKRGGVVGFWDYLTKRRETRLALIGGAGILLTLFLSAMIGLSENVTARILLGVDCWVAVYPIARNGINALRINREFSINLLMTIAALGAIVIGEYLESATVIFLFAIGRGTGRLYRRPGAGQPAQPDVTGPGPGHSLCKLVWKPLYPLPTSRLATRYWSSPASACRWMAISQQAAAVSIRHRSRARVCPCTKPLAMTYLPGASTARAHWKSRLPGWQPITPSTVSSNWWKRPRASVRPASA